MRGLIIGLSLYGMLAAAGTADAQSMTILVNGFSAGSGDEGQTGMEQLAATLRSRTVRDPGPRLEVRVYDWDQRETIRTLIEEMDTQRCLVLIGHSYGGATVIEVAEELNAIPVSIALLVQIDSVGLNDDELPNNVERGVNYSQRSHVLEELEMLLFPDRPQRIVNGAENNLVETMYGIRNNAEIDHTNVDDRWFGLSEAEYQDRWPEKPDLHQQIVEKIAAACDEEG